MLRDIKRRGSVCVALFIICLSRNLHKFEIKGQHHVKYYYIKIYRLFFIFHPSSSSPCLSLLFILWTPILSFSLLLACWLPLYASRHSLTRTQESMMRINSEPLSVISHINDIFHFCLLILRLFLWEEETQTAAIVCTRQKRPHANFSKAPFAQ